MRSKRFRCYHGTIRKPCGVDLVALEPAILEGALEHVRGAHPRFARSCADLAARLRDEIDDDVAYHPVGAGPVLFACQDLSPRNLWRCEFVQLGPTISACVSAALEHFATAHPRLSPDEAVIRAGVRSATSQKVSWAWAETPLHERWARRRG